MATIATEGVVGDKVLIIGPGSSTSPEAAPFTTLPSKETSDMAELIQKSTALVSNASVNYENRRRQTYVHSRCGNDYRQQRERSCGRVEAGTRNSWNAACAMRKPRRISEQRLRMCVDATSSLSHASAQADALVSDFQSRGLGGKVDAMVSDLQSRNLGEKLDQDDGECT